MARSRPRRASASTDWTKSGCWISRADTLTHRNGARSALPHDRAARQASARTQRPIGRIAPFSSAISMKSPGATSPRSGWSQRTRASTPSMPPPASDTIGWYIIRSWPSSTALRSCEASSWRSRIEGVHARVEDGEAGLPVRLRHVHREVGVADDVGGRLTGAVSAGDADADGDDDVVTVDEVGRPELAHEAFGHRHRAPQVGGVVGEDRELVAAEAGHEIRLADRPGDALGDADEEGVAGGVAEAVVDDLEVVEVDEQDGGRALLDAAMATRRRGQDALQGQLEHAAVGGAGQRVTLGEVLDVLEEDGVSEVERGHRARAGPGRSRSDARPRTRSADRWATTIAPIARPSATIGATRRLRQSPKAAARSGLRTGSRRLIGRSSRSFQARSMT